MIIPMLCVTIFVILVVWFLLPRVARLMIHTPTAISIFVCLSMVQLMAVFISMLFSSSRRRHTIFVKSGDEFVRVATNVRKDDGSRAIGTILDPKGKAIAAIAKGESYFGEADILGKPYVTGYEPIRDASNVIGVYYVGYLKK